MAVTSIAGNKILLPLKGNRMIIDAATPNIATPPSEVSKKTYWIIWGTLILLTFVTVAVAYIDLRTVSIIVCLAIAACKSCLVFLYFMHLRHEKRLVIKLVIPIAIIALAIFIGLTFSDVFTR